MAEKLWLLLIVALLFPSLPLLAQERKPMGEFNVGYSVLADLFSETHGANAGIIGNLSKWIGIEGQFDVWWYGNRTRVDFYSAAVGPRVAFRTRNVTPFVHALGGAAHLRSAGNTRFVVKMGAGVDFNFGRRQRYAWRLEVNDLMFVDPVDHFLNASTGFVYRWY